MTWVGLDVHARSTQGAAIHSLTGELERVRFGPGVEPVIEWLSGLPGPVRAVYEAGPTGFGLKRAADQAELAMQVIGPGKTPRAATDRVKTDRKDAELLARLLLAGQLSPVFVPDAWIESVRHLARRREQVRADVMRARHRISKLLLVEGRVYCEPTTWNVRPRQVAVAPSLRARADRVGLRRPARRPRRAARPPRRARGAPLAARPGRAAVANRRAAAVLSGRRHADRADLASRARRRLAALQLTAPARRLAGADPLTEPIRPDLDVGINHQDRLQPRAPPAGRVGLALHAPAAQRRHPAQPPNRSARPRAADRLARAAPPAQGPPQDARPRQAAQPHHRELA